MKKIEQDDYNAWLQGAYIKVAIGSTMDKKCKYPEAPFSIPRTTKSEMSEEDKFLIWINEFNRRF